MKFEKYLDDKLKAEDILEDDLIEFFSVENEESISLEFKGYSGSANPKKINLPDSILKSLSAMSNNDGGTLIWGSPFSTDKKIDEKNTGKMCTGDLKPTPKYAYESLSRVLRSKLFPTASHIRLDFIHVSEGIVWIFRVNPAQIPIMANDHRFYIRTNHESIVAEYSVVESLFRRFRHPNLFIEPTLGSVSFNCANPSITINTHLHNITQGVSARKAFIDCRLKHGHFSSHHPNEKQKIPLGSKLRRFLLIDPYNAGFTYSLPIYICYNDKSIQNEEITIIHGAIDTPIKESKITLKRTTESLNSWEVDTEQSYYNMELDVYTNEDQKNKILSLIDEAAKN